MTDSLDSDNPRPQLAGSGESPEAESVLAGIEKAAWSEEEGVSYEVAVDLVNEVVGAYSGLIGREEATTSPDPMKIAAWRQAKVDWSHRRRDLSPADSQAVQAVRREAAELLRKLTGRR